MNDADDALTVVACNDNPLPISMTNHSANRTDEQHQNLRWVLIWAHMFFLISKYSTLLMAKHTRYLY